VCFIYFSHIVINLPVNDILEISRNTVMTQKNDQDGKRIDNCFLSKLKKTNLVFCSTYVINIILLFSINNI